jgi:hypothetical protein
MQKEIESYLPLFTGFYNTQFECDCEDGYIEDGKTYDDYEWDYTEYHNRIAETVTELVADKLKSQFDITTEYQNLVSPKYYNFSNDSINVKYTLGENTLKKLLTFILDDFDEFDAYINYNYSSRDGFMSFYSNKGIDWIADYLMNEEKLNHVFGAILEYCIDYDLEDLVMDLYDSGETHIIGCYEIEPV